MRATALTETLVPEAEAVLAEALHRGGAAWDAVTPELQAALLEARHRGGAAWDALRGERVGPPVAARRWPWAVAAAAAGAGVGIAVAMVVRRLSTPDAPGALEPEQLQAVVDRPAAPS